MSAIHHQPPIARCHDTGKVRIGSAYVPRLHRQMTKDGEILQTALLDKRTATEPPIWRRALAPLWRLC